MFMRIFERLQIWLVIVPAMICFLCLSYQGILETRWLARQRAPVPTLEQVVPMPVANTTVYVAPWERDLSQRMNWCLYICAGLVIASEIGRRRLRII